MKKCVLTMDENPKDGDTITTLCDTFTFKHNPTDKNHIKIGCLNYLTAYITYKKLNNHYINKYFNVDINGCQIIFTRLCTNSNTTS